MMNLTDQCAAREGRGVRVRRVSVTDPIAAARHYDYADSFELRLAGPDRCSPEEWARAGVDATRAFVGILHRRTARQVVTGGRHV